MSTTRRAKSSTFGVMPGISETTMTAGPVPARKTSRVLPSCVKVVRSNWLRSAIGAGRYRGPPMARSPYERPFRFSVQCSSVPAGGRREWAELARRCEDLGYSTLTVADHFDDQLAPVPALMAAADATTELRIGAL